MIISVEKVPILQLGEKVTHNAKTYVVCQIDEPNDEVKLFGEDKTLVVVSHQSLAAKKMVMNVKRNHIRKKQA